MSESLLATLDAIRDALAECLWDEEPWLTDDLTELMERVYVMASGKDSAPDLLGTSTQSEGFPEGNDGETGAEIHPAARSGGKSGA